MTGRAGGGWGRGQRRAFEAFEGCSARRYAPFARGETRPGSKRVLGGSDVVVVARASPVITDIYYERRERNV